MKDNVFFARTIMTVVLIFLLCDLWLGLRAYFFHGNPGYDSMMINDWLINYEGGFVRRGLIGQLLLLAYRFSPYSVIDAIVAIYFVGFFVLVWILIHMFRKEGWSPFVIIFPVCLFVSFLGVRRDYWMLTMTFFMFQQASSYLRTQQKRNLFLFNILSVLAILIHEVTFFYTIPLLIVYSEMYLRVSKNSKLIHLEIFKLYLASILTMVAVCIYKGDAIIAMQIWESWDPIFPNPLSIGSAVEWLSYDTTYAITKHICRFWGSPFVGAIPSWPFTLFTLVAIYFLIISLNTLNPDLWPVRSFCQNALGSILLLQLFFLSIMFGLLSCDFSRIVMYWVVSSLIAFHWFNPIAKPPKYFALITHKILLKAKSLHKFAGQRTIIIYTILIFILPISNSQGANILAIFSFIPYGWRLAFWHHFLTTLPIAP